MSEGNKLIGIRLQREVDHLNWAGEVNKLLTDDQITELAVQTDPRKCGFGKWYYGEGRIKAENFLPSLKTPLSRIEEPHRDLHRSAIKISEVYKEADSELPTTLANREADHLSWAGKVQSAILRKSKKVDVQLDHTLCAFGKMLFGEVGKKIRLSDPELSKLLDAIEEPHQLLHDSGKKIQVALSEGDFDKAHSIYLKESAPILEKTQKVIKQLQHRAQENLGGAKKAQNIYSTETQANLEKVQGILHQMNKIAKENVISEDLMISKAVSTRMVVVIVVILALLIGIILALKPARQVFLD